MDASGEVDRFGKVLKKSREAKLAFERERMELDLAECRLDREGLAEDFKRYREAVRRSSRTTAPSAEKNVKQASSLALRSSS